MEIFNTLNNMSTTMKSFSLDIEQRLDKLYDGGAASKFGFEDVAGIESGK